MRQNTDRLEDNVCACRQNTAYTYGAGVEILCAVGGAKLSPRGPSAASTWRQKVSRQRQLGGDKYKPRRFLI